MENANIIPMDHPKASMALAQCAMPVAGAVVAGWHQCGYSISPRGLLVHHRVADQYAILSAGSITRIDPATIPASVRASWASPDLIDKLFER